jgi:hypothetical protein
MHPYHRRFLETQISLRQQTAALPILWLLKPIMKTRQEVAIFVPEEQNIPKESTVARRVQVSSALSTSSRRNNFTSRAG